MDPVMLIKIPFIQYLYGIKSMRQTMKEIEVNVAYRWFLGIDLDENELLKHPYQPVGLRHYRGDLTDIRPPDAVKYYRVG